MREQNVAGENFLTHIFFLSDTDIRPTMTPSMKQLSVDGVWIEVCDILEDTQKEKNKRNYLSRNIPICYRTPHVGKDFKHETALAAADLNLREFLLCMNKAACCCIMDFTKSNIELNSDIIVHST